MQELPPATPAPAYTADNTSLPPYDEAAGPASQPSLFPKHNFGDHRIQDTDTLENVPTQNGASSSTATGGAARVAPIIDLEAGVVQQAPAIRRKPLTKVQTLLVSCGLAMSAGIGMWAFIVYRPRPGDNSGR